MRKHSSLDESLPSANIDVDYTITMSYLGQDIEYVHEI